MTLRITKASDPIRIERIVMCVYGAPGLAKTSLAFTADDPLLLDFDNGVHRALFRKDAVRINAWRDVAGMERGDFEGYSTVIVDTVGRALDQLAQDLMENDPKMKNRSGGLSLQGFGALKAQFTQFLNKLKSFGLDVVLIAHMDEQKDGDDKIERIDVQGGSKNEIYKSSDAMGRLVIREGKRQLLFSPTDAAFGKNPAELDPLVVPRFDAKSRFLGEVIERTKEKINAMTEDQREVAALLTAWTERVHEATTGAAMTALVNDASNLDPRIVDNAKRLLAAYAKDHGFVWDAKKSQFAEKAEQAA